MTTLEAMQRTIGEMQVTLSTMNVYSLLKRKCALSTYLREMRKTTTQNATKIWYLFGDNNG
jgi:hypothetical protein